MKLLEKFWLKLKNGKLNRNSNSQKTAQYFPNDLPDKRPTVVKEGEIQKINAEIRG